MALKLKCRFDGFFFKFKELYGKIKKVIVYNFLDFSIK